MAAEARQSPGTVVVLGKVVGAYGVKGWVRIHPFADDPLSWRKIPQWMFRAEKDELADWSPVALRQLRVHSDGLIASFEGIDDRNASEAVVGQLVGALREAMPATSEGEFYWGDLVGLEVRNAQSELLGVVQELMETGANAVLVVLDADGVKRLLPFVASVVTQVDIEKKTVLVDWGLDW